MSQQRVDDDRAQMYNVFSIIYTAFHAPHEEDTTDRLTTIRESSRVLSEYTYTPCGKS